MLLASCVAGSRGPVGLSPSISLSFALLFTGFTQAGSLQVAPPEAKSNWLSIFHLEKSDSSLGAVADEEG